MAKTESPITLANPIPQRAKIARWVFEVRRQGFRGYTGQVYDLLRLYLAPQRLSPIEYYYYHLYDQKRFTEAERRAFIGHIGRRKIATFLNRPGSVILADDKLVSYTFLKGMGFPVPRLFALFHPTRTHGDVPALRTPDTVQAFLAEGMTYPCFGKPLGKSNAIGVASIRGYRAADDTVILAGDRAVKAHDLAHALPNFLPGGYLFVEHLWPHPAVREVCGDRLCTVRLCIWRDDQGPHVFAAVFKITTGANMADNFILTGNLLAAVDVATGTLTRIVGGSGPDEVEPETHPDTGQRMLGFRLPEWDAICKMACAAAGAFPGMPYQGWDVAITPTGPVLVELNSAGDFSLWQRAAAKGIMNDTFRAALRRKRLP